MNRDDILEQARKEYEEMPLKDLVNARLRGSCAPGIADPIIRKRIADLEEKAWMYDQLGKQQ